MSSPCRKPGCRGIAIEGKCSVCDAKHDQRDGRLTAAERGYGKRWARFARAYKERHPLCVVCELAGRTTLTDVPHHLVKVSEGGSLYPGDAGLLPVCGRCHAVVEDAGRKWGDILPILRLETYDELPNFTYRT